MFTRHIERIDMKRLKQIDLAKHLKCSRQAVSAHLKNTDAPQPDRAGLYDADEVKAYIADRRALDNDRPDSRALLSARIENLRLENQLLKQRLKVDRPSYAVEEVELLLWQFLAEARRHHIAAVNASAYLCINQPTPHPVLKILWEALNEAEGQIGAWCQSHGLHVNELRTPWPIPHPCFAWWMKDKAEHEQKPTFCPT
jgi:hypothetical protein